MSTDVGRAHQERRIKFWARLQELEDEGATKEHMRNPKWAWEPWFFLGRPHFLLLFPEPCILHKDVEGRLRVASGRMSRPLQLRPYPILRYC
jgi:hypothetical protein